MDLFNVKLWAILDALELSIKETKNRDLIMITIFRDSQAAIAKNFDPQVRVG